CRPSSLKPRTRRHPHRDRQDPCRARLDPRRVRENCTRIGGPASTVSPVCDVCTGFAHGEMSTCYRRAPLGRAHWGGGKGMPDFTVDIGGLEALQKNLTRVQENVDGATKRLDGLRPDSIGSDELDEACGDFRDAWKDGLEKIEEAIKEVDEGLNEAAKGYRKTEEGIRDALNDMRDRVDDLNLKGAVHGR